MHEQGVNAMRWSTPAENDRFRWPDESYLPQVRHAEERPAATPCRNPNTPKRVVYRLRLKICPRTARGQGVGFSPSGRRRSRVSRTI